MNLKTLTTNSQEWTLFLDRDGVINHRIIDDYVKRIEDFEFLEGAIEAIVEFRKHFRYIFIVTNQQGVGKGLMTKNDVEEIHNFMIAEIEAKGGKIDAVYFCPELKNTNSKCRKPEIGMALQAQKEFHGVDFSKSIMIGDSISDMEFGKNAGMHNIFIDAQKEGVMPDTAEFMFDSLKDFFY